MPKQLCQRCSAKKLDEVRKVAFASGGQVEDGYIMESLARLRTIRARLPSIQQHHGTLVHEES